jgi:coproporphyrinogen III oxidase-like Fe-S oxidoreductase
LWTGNERVPVRQVHFCDFRRDRLEIYGVDDLERQLRLLKLLEDDRSRMHFLGCDPFFLDTEKLLLICGWSAVIFPKSGNSTCTPAPPMSTAKTDEELLRLHRAGITELHIGLETGSDAVLSLHNKGETPEEIRTALNRLEHTGIKYHLTVIPGLGGKKYTREHAEKTAELLSGLHPETVWCYSLILWPNTPLYDMFRAGRSNR